MPLGRGDTQYIEQAAKKAAEILTENNYFSSAPDEVKAALVSGVFNCYASNIYPGYILETGDHYSK